MKLENRRAIVTGAAQGLGYAIAKRLNEEGCRVAMLDINEEKVCAAAAELKDCFGAKCISKANTHQSSTTKCYSTTFLINPQKILFLLLF